MARPPSFIANICAALTESPMAWALTARGEEEQFIHSEEGARQPRSDPGPDQ